MKVGGRRVVRQTKGSLLYQLANNETPKNGATMKESPRVESSTMSYRHKSWIQLGKSTRWVVRRPGTTAEDRCIFIFRCNALANASTIRVVN